MESLRTSGGVSWHRLEVAGFTSKGGACGGLWPGSFVQTGLCGESCSLHRFLGVDPIRAKDEQGAEMQDVHVLRRWFALAEGPSRSTESQCLEGKLERVQGGLLDAEHMQHSSFGGIRQTDDKLVTQWPLCWGWYIQQMTQEEQRGLRR